MKSIKTAILLLIFLPTLLMPQDNENRVYYTSIKPGVREILLGKKFSEIKKILNKKYNIKFVDDRADIFTGDLNIKAFIEKYSPVLTYLRSYRGWKYGKLLKFMENNIFKSFLEPVGRDEWLESDYPVRFKRWKRYRIMLKNFNPFVRRVDLAFYKNVLYYAKFYVKNHYRFNDTYLPKNEEKFLQHLYLKFKRIYGQPILFNNYQYHWRDNKVELALDGKNSTLTFTDYRTDKLVVRYLKNVSIVLARMQMRILNQADYVDKYLKDFE